MEIRNENKNEQRNERRAGGYDPYDPGIP